jgi:hypothetical protein
MGSFTCSDTLSNSYAEAIAGPTFYNFDAGGDRATIDLYFAENVAGGADTVTVTGATSTYLAWAPAEFSGIATTSSKDQAASNTATNTSTDANITSGTTSQPHELVLAVATAGIAGDINVAWGAAATTGYTNIGQFPNWNDILSVSFDYKIISSVGAQSANWSHDPCTGDTYNGWAAIIGTFRAATYPGWFVNSKGGWW